MWSGIFIMLSLGAICCGSIILESGMRVDGEKSTQKKLLCAQDECPKYTIVNKTQDYEVRKYPSIKYAMAQEEGLNFSNARAKNYWKLKLFLSGANNKKKQIRTGFPFINRLIMGGNGKVGNLYGSGFYLPEEDQVDPPSPTSSDVVIKEQPETLAFVRSFQGWPSESNILSNQEKLSRDLARTPFDYDPYVFYSAEYNEEYDAFDRYNEVVFVHPAYGHVV